MAKEFEHVSRGILSSELGIIGIPTNSSGAPDGVARAPKVLRQAGLMGALRARQRVLFVIFSYTRRAGISERE